MGEQKTSARKSPAGPDPAAENAVAAAPWQVPVMLEEVGETGRHIDLAADPVTRAAVARLAELRDLPRLEASFDLTRRGDGLHVAGQVAATVEQTCVVTLEPVTNEISERVDLLFAPRPAPAAGDAATEPADAKWNDPEPLEGGKVDLGALATEFLILGLDPYPRKAGAVFVAPPAGEPDPGPFAALAKLTKG